MGKKRYAPDGVLMGGVPKILILSGSVLALILLVVLAVRIKSDRVRLNDEREEESRLYSSDAMLNMLPSGLSKVSTVFVIPGGGPGLEADRGYPEWTKRRTLAAFEEYQRQRKQMPADGRDDIIFYALSAGSLNGPNQIGNEDGKIVFECQHVLKHLESLGVPKDRLFGDFVSWDTTANALSLRLLVEGLMSTYAHDPAEIRKSNLKKIKRVVSIEVFSSDFHVERIKIIFDWVFSLAPSLTNRVQLSMFNIPSLGVGWTNNKNEWEQRMRHEQDSIVENKKIQKAVKTLTEFQAFLLLGGHGGYRNYLFNSYTRSAGAGW